jgi:hypothetical protein
MNRVLEPFHERFEVLEPLPEPPEIVLGRRRGPARRRQPADALSQAHRTTVALSDGYYARLGGAGRGG